MTDGRDDPAAAELRAAATADVLPHRPPMLLIEGVLERAPGFVACRCRLGKDVPLASSQSVTSLIALELGAQASAFIAPSPAPAPAGGAVFLVSIRRATFHRDRLPLATPLRVEARSTGQIGGLRLVDVRIALESEPDRTLAEAQLGTFAPAAGKS
jgi:predicted hotdog family 3-hydroxylacyl-ACP dehydratase